MSNEMTPHEAVAEYQVKPKDGRVWRRVTKREYDDYSNFPGFRESDWDRRKLYTHPQPAAPARETDWNMREILSRAAPAPVAGDAVDAIAIALWHRFAPDDRIQWEDETEKAIYRDAAQQVAALAQDRINNQ